MTAAVLLLAQSAAEEHSTAYEVGRVFGTVLFIGLVLGGLYWLGTRLFRDRRTAGKPPAGWYPDPEGRSGQRWWDGERWTESRQE